MERCISEEFVTKSLLNWLEEIGWRIVAYDFPQSGTGVILHPNPEDRISKNKDSFIPDIVAYKGDSVVFFENKNRFVEKDFDKVDRLRHSSNYSMAIENLLRPTLPKRILYGVGMPYTERNLQKSLLQKDKVDFIIFSGNSEKIEVIYDKEEVFK